MKEETFIMVSLKDEKSKQLATAISNDTCRKILDYLANKEASESELSKKLNIPISTVSYNIKLLLDNGIIQSKEFVWSEKGKKIDIYTLAKKLIIIAPKEITGLSDQLKTLFPVALISAISTGIIYYLNKPIQVSDFVMAKSEIASSAPVIKPIIQSNLYLYFLFGAIIAILSYFIINLIRRKK